MSESDRPSSSSSSSGDRFHGVSSGAKRIPLKQSRSVDAAACMFEMEGLDFDDDDDDRYSPSNNRSPKSFGINRKSDTHTGSNVGGRRRRIGVTSIDDEDFNNNTNDSNDENDDDNDGEESNKKKNNRNRKRRGNNRNPDDGDLTDDDNDDDNDDEDEDEDDEEEDDDDSDTRNMFQRMSLNSKCTRQFATSLPIQVPLWKTSPLNQETDDTDTEQNITCDEDPRKLAESFRALAWSVKDGTTEMFGALPRHRLKSRPI